MGLRDKTVEFEPHAQMDAMIQGLIDETHPSVIISFYPITQYILTMKLLQTL